MAATKNLKDVRLQVRVEKGTTTTGKTMVKTLGFSQISNSATDDQLYAAGQAIASLVTPPLDGIRLVNTYDLTATA